MDIEEKIDRVVSYLLLATNRHLPLFDGAYFTEDSSISDVGWLWSETFDTLKKTLQSSGDLLDISAASIEEEGSGTIVALRRYRAGCAKTNRYLRRIPDGSHWMATVDMAAIEQTGRVPTPMTMIARRIDGAWCGVRGAVDEIQHDLESFFPSLWITARLFWSVRLGFLGHPGISILTTNTGAREAFRLRDIPNGERRRKALAHFVKEHMRRAPITKNDVRVEEHVRGVEDFSWNGLQCRISPPSINRERHLQIVASLPDEVSRG